ncbi:MAG: hypothetical protein COA99_07880 [Moraxellaceae bacterium]|nr:MAG: hypothetical protein COA99_07880 [Moraxellaceae bacterium]
MNLGIISSFLVWSAFLVFLLRLRSRSSKSRVLIAIIIAATCALTFSNLLLPLYIRGLIGDLSIVSQLLLAIYIVSSVGGIPVSTARKNEYQRLSLFMIITACWFYPTTLGLTYFDPYAFGYKAAAFHWCVTLYFFFAALIFYRKKHLWACSIIAIATLGFYLHLLESDNYWDYMIDPGLTLGALIYLISNGIILLKKQLAR